MNKTEIAKKINNKLGRKIIKNQCKSKENVLKNPVLQLRKISI